MAALFLPFFNRYHRLASSAAIADARDHTILETDQLVAKASHPYRDELETRINTEAVARLNVSSAKKLVRASLEHEAKKPRQQLAVGVAIDFS